MHIYVPDEFPGRCKNIRQHQHHDGSYEMLRCLGGEEIRHVCEFPEPEKRAENISWANNMYNTKKTPTQWKAPEHMKEPEKPAGNCLKCQGRGSFLFIDDSRVRAGIGELRPQYVLCNQCGGSGSVTKVHTMKEE